MLRFYAGAQVRAGDLSIGALCVFDPNPRPNEPGEKLDRLSSLASEVREPLRQLAPRSG